MASGETLAKFFPQMNEPPAATFATADVRNSHPVLDFDDSNDESAVFSDILASGYSSGGTTVKVHFAMSSATVGTFTWAVAWERVGTVLDIDGDSFATANSVQVAVATTAGALRVATITFNNGADMDSVATGEFYRLKVTGLSTGGASGDAEFRCMEVLET